MDCDFTLTYYRTFLKLLQEKYVFIPFSHYKREYGQYMLLRHDIDCAPERALSLAVEENRLGIHATYFINPHSCWYNPFDIKVVYIIKKIMELGHYLGLHFDLAYWGIPTTGFPLDKYVEREKLLVESMYGVRLMAVSFHNPKPETLSMNQKELYCELVNCNGVALRTVFKYFSDSSCSPLFVENILLYDRVQLLVNPIWWTINKKSQKEKVRSYLVNSMTNRYRAYLKRRESK